MTRRLSPTVRPDTIALHVHLDPGQRTFRGEASYALDLAGRTRRLVLHAADLRLSRVRVHAAGASSKPRVEMRPEDETVVLHCDRALPRGRVELELAFRGSVRNDLRGVYASEDRATPWLATQLCPSDARRFFPCFDEPGIKARYRIRVTAPRDQTVVSNSPVESIDDDEGATRTIAFATTPPLSAYLVAVAVGPFEATPVRTSGSTPIRVLALPGRGELAAFAAEAAVESLARLEAWFDLAHPYPKLDLVALPDFAFGAMENAGAVFFRDSILLLDREQASAEDRKRTAETIAHELSHMWFGNLVTMAWWNDLWLNESFATWMAYEIVDQWRPEWRIWCDFAHRREIALRVDALATSHPIAPRIRSAEEAHENFDAITYTKGASVLRMLEGFLGRDVFREGIRLYIRRHREGTATATDLWDALGEASGVSVDAIVAPWTLQMGYPLVRAKRGRRDGRAVLTLSQERFLALPPRRRSMRSRTTKGRPRKAVRWSIPWVGRIGPSGNGDRDRSGKSRVVRLLLSRARDAVPISGATPGWIYANAGETGFFRVEHAPAELDALLAHLPRLSAVERIGFVGHQWALTQAGRLEIAKLLELIEGLTGEEDPDVLLAVETVLAELGRRLAPSRGPQVEKAWRRWVAGGFAPALDRIGLDARREDDERLRMRRARLLAIVGRLGGLERVREICATRCAHHLETGESLPRDLADEIVRIAAGGGGAALHARLCRATKQATTPQERRRMLLALAEFDASDRVDASLRLALDPRFAPAPDRAGLLGALLSRPGTAVRSWRRIQRAWPRLERQMPPILLARLASATAAALPPTSAPEIRAFFDAHPLAAGARVLRQIAEEMAIARRFEATAGEDFEAFLGSA